MENRRKHVCVLQTSFAKREDTIAYLKSKVPDVRVSFITDDTLLADIREHGSPTNEVIARMTMYAMAAEKMGATLILNSCSTVGEVADLYAQCVSIPVVKIDEPMAQKAVELGTKVALIATVPTTLPPSQRMIERLGRAQGKEMRVEQFIQAEAWSRLEAGDPAGHNQILMDAIRGLDQLGFDAIVMAQVSMRALLPELGDVKTPLLCSFYSGLDRVAELLG